MKIQSSKVLAISTLVSLFLPLPLSKAKAPARDVAPLKLVKTITLPSNVKGPFDHFGIDLEGHRLFATPESYKAVLVFDLNTSKLMHQIAGIERPHTVLYRNDLNRIYVTDGNAGDLKIFNGKTYALLKSVKLLADADGIGYDPVTKYLYIDNGGGDVHQTYSMLSVVDTTAGQKLADIQVPGETIEAMALETVSPKIYLNNKTKNQVDAIDRGKRKVVASWPVTKAKQNVAMAFDETHHRLFVGCRSGEIVVFDTQSGKELTTMPINKGVDDMVFDLATKRIYVAGDRAVDVFEETDPDHFKSLGKVPTGPDGKTALLVPELNRYFVVVPQHGNTNTEVMVFAVQ